MFDKNMNIRWERCILQVELTLDPIPVSVVDPVGFVEFIRPSPCFSGRSSGVL